MKPLRLSRALYTHDVHPGTRQAGRRQSVLRPLRRGRYIWVSASTPAGEHRIHEAFPVVPMALMQELSLPAEKVNPLGGAIALGHPIGASGARTLVTMLNALSIRRQRTGIVSLCVGGGEAVALAVERC